MSSLDVTALSDAALAAEVIAARRGGAAESELCRRFAPRVRLYGLRHLGSEDAADELVQRVLERVLRKLRDGAVNEPGRLAGFVLGVARMVTHETRRHQRREAPIDDIHVYEGAVDFSLPLLAPAKLGECLQALSERERSVVVMAFFEDNNTQEIADLLSTSLGNVRVLRHRAIQRLQQCLGLELDA